jgi:CubicO group peptidase (beta-lactamase class C family)
VTIGTLEERIESLRVEHRLPGLAVAVFDRTSMLFDAYLGARDVELGLPVTADTVFGLASITKSFTSLAVLILASRGLLDLDEPVDRYLPRVAALYGSQPFTIRHALSHTSGLPATPALSLSMSASQVGDPCEDVVLAPIRDLPAVPLESVDDLIDYLALQATRRTGQPGDMFCYQNDVYGLLGYLVATAAGATYAGFVESEILGPLGLTRTGYAPDRLPDGDLTMLYVDAHGALKASPRWQESEVLAAAGFLKSSMRDVVVYARQFLAGFEAIGLPPDLYRQMVRPHAWCDPEREYGLGLQIGRAADGASVVGHPGGLKGVSSYFAVIPERHVGAAVLCNVADAPVRRIWREAVGVVTGIREEPAGPSSDTGSASRPERLQRFLGTYRSGEPWGIITVRDESGRLSLRCGHDQSERFEAQWLSDTDIAVDTGKDIVPARFLVDASGEVRALHYSLRVHWKEDAATP